MDLSRRKYLQAAGGLGALAAAGVALPAWAQGDKPDIPSTMVWSTYDVGSTGYVEASAIADAFGKKFGTRVRLQPSGTSIGRLQPVLTKRVPFGWLANEVFFASEGLYEFCTPKFGPQDLRVLAGRPASLGMAVAGDAGIKTAADLKGKRLAYAKANTSVNAKMEPILAFGGLTLKDMELVEVPSYGASMKAVVEGRADACGTAPTAATMYELESSPRGIGWVPMPPEDKAGWARAQEMLPIISPFEESVGAGLSKEHPVWMIGYHYPMITVRADFGADEAYGMVEAVAEAFDLYKDAAPIMTRWKISEASKPPMDAPFHDGAIRYLKKIGQWDDEKQTWQDGMVKRHLALQGAWKTFIQSGAAKKADADGLRELWGQERQKVLNTL